MGCLDSVEWNGGLERWNGMVDWNGGMEWWTGTAEWNGGKHPLCLSVKPKVLILTYKHFAHIPKRVSGFSGMEWWTGTVEWNGGLERWNGMVDWNGRMEWWKTPIMLKCKT